MGIRLRNGRIRFKGMPGGLRVHMHRPLPTECHFLSCTLKRDLKGWVVGFAAEIGEPAPRLNRMAVGLDLGLTALAALSDGSTIPNLRAGAAAGSRRVRLQRSLSRKQHGSKGRNRARTNLGRCCAQAARRRANHLHHFSAEIVRRYDIVAIEDLGVRRLAGGMLAGPIRDAAWGKFILMLKYKAKRAGAKVVEVDPRHTSQDCSACGARSERSLKDRWHQCGICGLSIGRDHNAALNILHRAGVGPGLLNVAVSGKRASEKRPVYKLETLPYMCSPPNLLPHMGISTYAYICSPPFTDRLVPVM